MAREKTIYVLCTGDDREYEQIRARVGKEMPGAECIQAIPVGYLTQPTELACAFFVGNGNIRDDHKRQTERQMVITEAIKASNHWTPGSKGRFGSLRLVEFLGACAQAIRDTTSRTDKDGNHVEGTGIPANTTIRHYNDELTLQYG